MPKKTIGNGFLGYPWGSSPEARRWLWGTTPARSPCWPQTHRPCLLGSALVIWAVLSLGEADFKNCEMIELLRIEKNGQLKLLKTHEKSVLLELRMLKPGAALLFRSLQVELCTPGAVLHIENAQIATQQSAGFAGQRAPTLKFPAALLRDRSDTLW